MDNLADAESLTAIEKEEEEEAEKQNKSKSPTPVPEEEEEIDMEEERSIDEEDMEDDQYDSERYVCAFCCIGKLLMRQF